MIKDYLDSVCWGYFEYINWSGKTCPLWAASFLRQGALNYLRVEKASWAVLQWLNSLFCGLNCEYNMTSCFNILIPWLPPAMMNCVFILTVNIDLDWGHLKKENSKNCLKKIGLWPCLWRLVFIDDWYGRAQPTIGGINPRPKLHKKASRDRKPQEQAQ